MGPDCGGGSGGAARQVVLKKGPWSAAEDARLVEYVRMHGDGNWNAVQRNSGLMRCGKSCRLRWANHLRPNLKKGAITAEEERLIIDLHAKFGNKWARMAVQLPGRTDNEIKNYWNTRVKRRQRAGLPIYPQEIPKYHPYTSSSSPSSSRLQNAAVYNHPPSINNNYFKLFLDNNNGAVSLSLSPSSSGSSNPLFLPKPSFRFDSVNFNINPSPPVMELGHSLVRPELPSIQSPLKASSYGADNYGIAPGMVKRNNGYLEDFLEESQALIRAQKSKSSMEDDKGKEKWVPENGFMGHYSTAAHASYGIKAKDGIEEMNTMDEDLLSLLQFPMSVPVLDWSRESGDISNEDSLNVTDDETDIQQEVLHSPTVTTSATAGSSCWNNMQVISGSSWRVF